MKKNPNAPKTKSVSFSVTDRDIDLINDLLLTGNYLNASDVIRNAIRSFYREIKPDYIYNRSAKDKAKRQEQLVVKKFEEMDDMEYAMSFKPLIIENRDGKPYAVFRALGTDLRTVAVEGIKKWATSEAFVAVAEGNRDDDDGGWPTLRRLHQGGWVNEYDREYNIDLKAYLEANPLTTP